MKTTTNSSITTRFELTPASVREEGGPGFLVTGYRDGNDGEEAFAAGAVIFRDGRVVVSTLGTSPTTHPLTAFAGSAIRSVLAQALLSALPHYIEIPGDIDAMLEEIDSLFAKIR